MRKSERRKSKQERKRADAGRRRFLKHATIAGVVLSTLNNALGIFDRIWSWRPAPAPQFPSVVVTPAPAAARTVAILPAVEIDVALPITPVKSSSVSVGV